MSASRVLVRVALPVPLPQLFDYALENNAGTVFIGSLVRVPFGRGEKTGVIIDLPAQAAVVPGRLKVVREVLAEVPPMPASWLALTAFAAGYYQHPLGEVVSAALPPGLRKAGGVPRDDDPLLAATAAGRAALAAAPRLTKALSLVSWLAAAGPHKRSRLIEHLGENAAVAIRAARNAGWVDVVAAAASIVALDAPALNAAQADAVAAVQARLGSFAPFLLHGVTGSGKTEVYLHLIAACLAQGRSVLMLVPEIGLTPQLLERVAARFPGARWHALHSGVAEGARSRAFVQALRGEVDILLGTRLSVFVPLARLGLVIVDEEHDASFKQQDGLRYSARDLAIWRGRAEQVPVLLGSATPALESWLHAESGRYVRLDLPDRAVAEQPPTVHLVDTRRAKLEQGLSTRVVQGLAERLARGEQSLVFLNRRGYAPVVHCAQCGWVSACRHCSANMVFHQADRRLRCHHCGAEEAVPRHCPTCGNADLDAFGRGTQRLEERLRELFPAARVLRVDRDAVRSPRQWEAVRGEIARGEADILVGTQMLAKGHDFPSLTLVAVVGADASLFSADYRAPERLFQQLMQVAGRSGRGELPGEVLVQTEYPDHALYQSLARHDFAAFARQQLDERQQAGFPPYSYHAVLRAEAPGLAEAMAFLKAARDEAVHLAAGVNVFDPVPMRLVRRARLERAQLLLEAASRPLLQGMLGTWLPRLYGMKTGRELRWHVDVDPVEIG